MKEAIISNLPPVAGGEESFIFISYSHKDKDMVYSDLWDIHERGFRFWYDDGITAGEVWNQTVEEKLASPACKLAIFFVSENTVISPAIRMEMELVKRFNKPFFTINTSHDDVQTLIANAFAAKLLRFSDMALYGDFFDEDIIYIKRNEPDYLTNVAKQCMRYGLEASLEIVTVKKTSQKVLILCKNSSFSNSIINGVYDFLSTKENVIIDKKLIDKNLSRLDCAMEFSRILSESIDEYDGFILRVPEKYNEQLLSHIRRITELGKKIVLLDIELKEDMLEGISLPSYVGSDFVTGGALLGERIGDLAQKLGTNSTGVVLFEGPYANLSAKRRCDSLYGKLIARTPNASVLRHNLPSLNTVTAINYMKDRASEWEESRALAGKNVILFCGIDNIAVEVMHILARGEEFNPIYRVLKGAKKLILAGYDGIRDAMGEVVLKNYGIDFLTIDVVPFKQGVNAGQKMYSLLFDRDKNGSILTQPELIEYIRFGTEKFESAKDIEFLLRDKKVFIFDLDGTIADTETLHWEAYNVLLKEHGVVLSTEQIKRYIGNSELVIYKRIKEDFSIDFDEEEFLERRIQIYLDLVEKKNLRPFPFIYDILKGTKAKCALVTSQIPPVVNRLLSLWGLEEYFPEARRFCCHDGVYNKKDIYKNVSAYLHLDLPVVPSEVLLFEDSVHYIAEAQKLSIPAVGIEHKFNRHMLKGCAAIMTCGLHRGAFVGLCGLDSVYYGNEPLPEENTKIRISDFTLAVGGPAANAAIAYAKLGGEAYLITRIGESPEGALLKAKLKEQNVRVIDIDANNESARCNVSFVYINRANGSRTICSGQTGDSGICDVDFEEVIKKVDFVLYDGNLPKIEEKMLRYVEYYDKDLVLDAGSYKKGFPECFYRATAVISSESFLDPEGADVFALQKKYGFKYAAKTFGGKSIVANEGQENSEIPVEKVDVVDTLGAGDIIHGAFCFFFYVRKLPFREALHMAARVATLSVTQKGVAGGLDYAIDHL